MRRKENKESFLIRWRKSVILHIKEKLEFIDVRIMAHVLTIVLLVSVIAGTVAWYYINTTVGVMGMYLSSGAVSEIEVSIDKDNWNNILTPDVSANRYHAYGDSTLSIDISMPAFQNIYDKEGNKITSANAGILAPGTYGSFSFYVKSVNESCKTGKLSVTRLLDSVETTDTRSKEIAELFQGHVLCFAQVDDGSIYEYISEEEPLEISFGEFTGKSEPKKVTVYWVWPYEYEDIAADTIKINQTVLVGTPEAPASLFSLPENLPDALSVSEGHLVNAGDKIAMNQLFEWERYKETLADYKVADAQTRKAWLMEWYDYADTLIGSYVKNMVFHMEVKGVTANGEE